MSCFNITEKKEVNEFMKAFEEIQELEKDPNLDTIYFKKYKAIKKIAEGSFGLIYEGRDIKTNFPVAIKLEDHSQYHLLEQEAYNLLTAKGFGIVKIISFGKNKKYNIMIQPLLGESLYQKFLSLKKKFLLKDIFLIGLQCLDRIEWIHTKSLIHRDIKPENFLFGRKDPRIIYMIDFGLSKKYRSNRTMKHIQFCLTKNLTGTARYASVNALKGFELSRRDDLESFCYMIIFFILKKLPWQGIKAQTQAKRYEKICEIKEEFNIDRYKNIIPLEVMAIFKYVKKLKFDEEPNYDKIRNLFRYFLRNIYYNENDTFSWINDKKILSLKKSSDMHRRKSSSKKRIIENMYKKGNLLKYCEIESYNPQARNLKINLQKNKQTQNIVNSEIINFKPKINKKDIYEIINSENNNFTTPKKEENKKNLTCSSRRAYFEKNIEKKNSKNNSIFEDYNKKKKQIKQNKIDIKYKLNQIDTREKNNISNNEILYNEKKVIKNLKKNKIENNLKIKGIKINTEIVNLANSYNIANIEASVANNKFKYFKPKEYSSIFKLNKLYDYKNNNSKFYYHLTKNSLNFDNRKKKLILNKKEKSNGNLFLFYNNQINYKSIFYKNN